MLCLGKSFVVILNYALTAEQPDPCGPEPYSPGKRPRTRSPLGEGPVTPRVPEEVALRQNSLEPRTSRGVPDPHILSGPLSGVEPTPRLGLVRSRHVSAGAGTRAGPRGFAGRLTYLQHSMRKAEVRSATAEPEAAFDRLH